MYFNIYYHNSNGPLIPYPTIDKFFINSTTPKIDLEIRINKLLENYIEQGNLVAYEVETNASNISNLISGLFELNFEFDEKTRRKGCFFKKTNKNLYTYCAILKKKII